MKKQIFLLIIVLILSIATSWAQTAVHNTPAQTVTCVDPANPDPLRPIAGVPYRYEADVTPFDGTAKWFVTTDIQFINNGSFSATEQAVGGSYIGAATGLGDNANIAANPTGVDITWKSEGLSEVDYTSDPLKPLFVGVLYTAPADACANNIQVFRINPIIAFTLDITNVVDNSGTYESQDYGVDVPQCFDVITSAVYDVAVNEVKMNYGTQTLFYEIIAANFSTSFDFWLQLDGLAAGQTADISWGYTPATATTLIGDDVSGVWTMLEDDAITALTDATNTSTGVSIYVKVVISNNTHEGTADLPITLRVDGKDSAENADVDLNCDEELAFADEATRTIEKRPTVDNPNPADTDYGFIPKN